MQMKVSFEMLKKNVQTFYLIGSKMQSARIANAMLTKIVLM
jgi:hypothetical protein